MAYTRLSSFQKFRLFFNQIGISTPPPGGLHGYKYCKGPRLKVLIIFLKHFIKTNFLLVLCPKEAVPGSKMTLD